VFSLQMRSTSRTSLNDVGNKMHDTVHTTLTHNPEVILAILISFSVYDKQNS
jgi:hypothetical protein